MKALLFLCTGNSCRSQMAEGFARAAAPPGVEVFSAGIDPRPVHVMAAAVMAEAGIDISNQRSKDLSQIPVDRIDTVVTLCGHAAENCPVFPGKVTRLHWDLADPAKAEGTEEEKMKAFRAVRDALRTLVLDLFSDDPSPTP